MCEWCYKKVNPSLQGLEFPITNAPPSEAGTSRLGKFGTPPMLGVGSPKVRTRNIRFVARLWCHYYKKVNSSIQGPKFPITNGGDDMNKSIADMSLWSCNNHTINTFLDNLTTIEPKDQGYVVMFLVLYNTNWRGSRVHSGYAMDAMSTINCKAQYHIIFNLKLNSKCQDWQVK